MRILNRLAVAIRYGRADSVAVPQVTHVLRGVHALEAERFCLKRSVPLYEQAQLAHELAHSTYGREEKFIPESSYDAVAKILLNLAERNT